MQWPREECRDPDASLVTVSALQPVLSIRPYDVVPAAVVRATCEMARELLIADRTAAPAGEGISATQTSKATTPVRAERADVEHELQQGGHAADNVARRAGDAGEVRGGEQGRQWERAAGESMKWMVNC